MESPLDVTIEVEQNRLLPTQEREMRAVLKVTAGKPAAGAPRAPADRSMSEVIVIDCSSSMGEPTGEGDHTQKIVSARRATRAAIDVLPDGLWFAVVEGTHQARMIYPERPGLIQASQKTRARAKEAVSVMTASGGTAIGRWLRFGLELFDSHPTAIRHLLLLTDGRDEHETAEELEAILAGCAGRFVCDARGIGDGWEPRELKRIAEVLHGEASAVRRSGELEADFRQTMHTAMGKMLAGIKLRITTMDNVSVAYLKQVMPTLADLEVHRADLDAGTSEFATGSWGNEEREYQICLRVDSTGAPLLEDIRVARAEIVFDGQAIGSPADIFVYWTDDPKAVTRPHPSVTHYTQQEQLSDLVNKGCNACDVGDWATAEVVLAHAYGIAAVTGNQRILDALRRVVEVDPDGTVRLRPGKPSTLDLKLLAMDAPRPSRFIGVAPQDATPTEAPGAAKTCSCGWVSPPDANYCENCRKQWAPK